MPTALVAAIMPVIAFAILSPLACGLLDTSRWVAKMVAPPNLPDGDGSSQFLRFGQAAMLDGWPSNIPFIQTILFVSAIISGFAYRWWAGIAVYLVAAVAGAFTKVVWGRSAIYYLLILYHRMSNRTADYNIQGDLERSEAAQSYLNDLERIMELYLDSGLKPPTYRQLALIPFGDLAYWLHVGSATR